jgi:putative autotransporter adhesin-like protein
MNRNILYGLLMLLLATVACSGAALNPDRIIGSGNVITENRDVSGFNSIDLQGSGNVNVTFGPAESVTVEADDNIVPLIETTVSNGKLIIRNKPNVNINVSNPIRINVTMKSISGIMMSGSGNINVSDLVGKDLMVALFGSGDITVNGEANTVNIQLPGSGNILCKELKADSVTVTLNGSGNITVYASESLDASIHGSGTINYAGNPAQINKSILGSGSITP